MESIIQLLIRQIILNLSAMIILTPTVASIILGYIISSLTPYLCDSLDIAVGLMFADYYMFRRLSYIDPETGFFNEKYMRVLFRAAKKKNINELMTIRFRISSESGRFAGILNSWKPEHGKIITKAGGEFLVISKPLRNDVAERFISLINEDCKKEGIETLSSIEKLSL